MTKVLLCAEQIESMRRLYPSLRPRIKHSNSDQTVIWTGDLKPDPVCASYRVRITYSLGRSPQVEVLNPPLRPGPNNEPIPHVYPQKRLCLFLPNSGEWDSSKRLSDTILPWTLLWLFHYELWQVTGQWSGGGKDHPLSNSSTSKDGSHVSNPEYRRRRYKRGFSRILPG